ncbi:MAG: magnesium/cobalt efflux protein [Alphaproteobacteria bacterium GWF2_58_20]|nr:MAG: magnesium/cobalt efflux protein [Alphaproteobacteria bacterium GWF2_58_20]
MATLLRDGENDPITDLMPNSKEEAPPFTPHERMLIANVLEVRNLTAADLMVPRADMVCVNIKASLEELLDTIAEHPHSRLPVYRDSMDDIIGVVHMKDILSSFAHQKTFKIEEHLREIMIIAPSMHALDLLLEMRKTRLQIATVVDEYGGIDGLLTIEDLVEGIVGEIEDEWESAEVPQIAEEPSGSLLADARLPIVDFEKRVGSLLDEEEREDIDTLGGFVVFMEGRVPTRGELLKHPSGLEFEIVDADPRRIKKIRVRNAPPAATQEKENSENF